MLSLIISVVIDFIWILFLPLDKWKNESNIINECLDCKLKSIVYILIYINLLFKVKIKLNAINKYFYISI